MDIDDVYKVVVLYIEGVELRVDLMPLELCCDVAVTQINYPNLKHNTQDSIEQVRGWSHEEGLSEIFMPYDMQFGGGFGDYLG